jgi:hypothetical protein
LVLGLDFHGVCDTYPEMFEDLSKSIMYSGGKVYIITGAKVTPFLIEDLKNYRIEYTNILSIIDYHAKNGVDIRYDEKGEPWINDDLWNSTKANLCEEYNVDIHIDDSEIYGKYFTGKTKYLLLE